MESDTKEIVKGFLYLVVMGGGAIAAVILYQAGI